MCRCIFLSPVILILTCGSLLAQQDKPAQPGNDFSKRQQEMVAGQMLASQMMQMAWNSDMHKELELVPDQIEQLKEISQEYQKLMIENAAQLQENAEKIRELSSTGDHTGAQAVAEKLQTSMVEWTRDLSAKSEEILLPHQMERLKQLVKQQTMKHSNPFRDEFGIAYGLAKELGLTKDEAEKLKKTIEEVRRQYYADLEKLKAKANKKILEAIPGDKRQKLEELTGKFYDSEKSTRRALENLTKENSKKKTESKSDNGSK